MRVARIVVRYPVSNTTETHYNFVVAKPLVSSKIGCKKNTCELFWKQRMKIWVIAFPFFFNELPVWRRGGREGLISWYSDIKMTFDRIFFQINQKCLSFYHLFSFFFKSIFGLNPVWGWRSPLTLFSMCVFNYYWN